MHYRSHSYQRAEPLEMKGSSEKKQPRSHTVILGTLMLLGIFLAVLIPNMAPLQKDGTIGVFASAGSFPNANDVCTPKRLRLSQATNVDEHNQVSMTVTFHLEYPTCENVRPVVSYGQGFTTEGLVNAIKPKHFNYTSEEVEDLFQSDLIYHVELPGLRAGLIPYWYRIQVSDEPSSSSAATLTGQQVQSSRSLRTTRQIIGETATFRFNTPPLPGAPTSLALVGDLGQTNDSFRTLMHIGRAATTHQNPISQLVIAGDMSYADSDPHRWNSWFDMMQPVLRMTPLQVAAGNHEIECNTDTLDIFVPYENYFSVPNRVRDAEQLPITDDYRKSLWKESCSSPSTFLGHYQYGNSFYSYQHGLIHTIVLNSYTFSTKGSIQYQWLEQELQNIQRKETPWVMVVFHCPIYTTFLSHVDEVQALQMKRAFEPLFLEYGVNLIISGHDHAYMRTTSLKYGQPDPTGRSPVYLILGAGGNREGHSRGMQEPVQSWVSKRSLEDFGYGHLEIPNATHARFRWIPDGMSPDAQDEVWWTNPHV